MLVPPLESVKTLDRRFCRLRMSVVTFKKKAAIEGKVAFGEP
jgi:hypothetical protein